MSKKELLFSFQGRIGRKTYWMWNLVYYLMITAFVIGANVVAPSVAPIAVPIFIVLIWFPDLAVTAKRWHDRGKSARWLLLNIPLVLSRVAIPFGTDSAGQPSTLQTVFSFVALMCGLWILVECGFLKGQQEQNQYGPEPE